jgi:hypothetical protein
VNIPSEFCFTVESITRELMAGESNAQGFAQRVEIAKKFSVEIPIHLIHEKAEAHGDGSTRKDDPHLTSKLLFHLATVVASLENDRIEKRKC